MANLVIKVSKIEALGFTAEQFAKKNNLWGVTNGELWVLTSMQMPSDELFDVAHNILMPSGLLHIQDFVYLEEQNTIGVIGREDEYGPTDAFPDIKEITWLDKEKNDDG